MKSMGRIPRALVHAPELPARESVAAALGAAEVEVVSAETLAEAADGLDQGAFDILVLDIRLEDPAAVALLDTIRRRRGAPELADPTCIVALSSAADLDHPLAAEKLGEGVDEVISRETPPSVLAVRVLFHLHRKQKQEAAAREVESFTYTMSHDLRAPLRAIEGFARALEEDEGHRLQADGKRHLERIFAGTRRMSELIEDLLTLSRAERVELFPKEVDLGRLSASVLEDLRARSPERKVKVEIRDGLKARGDESLLRTALEHLLGNAWKFTERTPDAAIRVGSQLVDSKRTFYVEDNGAGFAQEHAEQVFAPFKRVHSPREGGGSGIGLAVVRRIVGRHGGRVWAEGTPGKGATFRFTLE